MQPVNDMKRLILVLAAAICLAACEKLPLQKQYKYNPEPLDPNQGVTCWEYICSQSNLATMKTAVELCSLTDYYSCAESKYTYLLLDETAFNNYILSSAKVSAVNEMDPDKLTDILLFHIIKGSYSSYYGTISYSPEHVITLWKSQDAIMTIKLFDAATTLSQRQQDKVTLMDQCGSSAVVTATSCDILMSNGPAHILSKPCIYTR